MHSMLSIDLIDVITSKRTVCSSVCITVSFIEDDKIIIKAFRGILYLSTGVSIVICCIILEQKVIRAGSRFPISHFHVPQAPIDNAKLIREIENVNN